MERQRVLVFIVALTFAGACSGTNGHSEQKPGTPAERAASQPQMTASCDEALWQHVYDPTRLEVVERCRTVTGSIEELDQNEDGDTHMLLKLDPGQDDLLKKKNEKKKDGDLVIEVVCGGPVKDKKAKDACKDYSNPVSIPGVGDRVQVTGSYVIDSHNGWAEIHPVSRIEPLKAE